ncbi:hypothetical protein [Sphingorhabdus sp.]|jgi:hypothetical protein|uniref:hypothetical protein n=1 Tax=Sphingorhabdus sp. TaxID=1902408 RepID=UPI00378516B5
MSVTSRIYNSAWQRDGEELKRDGWRSGILAVSVSDKRLTSLEREAIRAIGERLYGGLDGTRA